MRDRDLTQTTDEPSGLREYRALDRSDQLAISGIMITLLMSLILWIAIGQLWGDGWVSRHSATPRQVAFQVDINRAAWPEIAALPMLGERLARDIVTWRTQHGPFSRLDQLAMIYGIGTVTLEQISPHVIIPSATGPAPAIARHAVPNPGQTR